MSSASREDEIRTWSEEDDQGSLVIVSKCLSCGTRHRDVMLNGAERAAMDCCPDTEDTNE